MIVPLPEAELDAVAAAELDEELDDEHPVNTRTAAASAASSTNIGRRIGTLPPVVVGQESGRPRIWSAKDLVGQGSGRLGVRSHGLRANARTGSGVFDRGRRQQVKADVKNAGEQVKDVGGKAKRAFKH